ncbi:hypothetical protein SUGI_0001930 [Cryptomeria japonica]|nr:hypothetical protein SUGI_0001930 [Cryptomeria japonica]
MVEFELKEARNKILRSLWKCGENFVYVLKWEPNFDLKKMVHVDSPTWIQLYYLPFEFWSEESLQRIGNILGQILNFDMGEEDTIHFVRIQIIAIVKIPKAINLRTKGGIWTRSIEIEKKRFFCLRCRRRNHFEAKCRIPENKFWRRKETHPNNKKEEEWGASNQTVTKSAEDIPLLEYYPMMEEKGKCPIKESIDLGSKECDNSQAQKHANREERLISRNRG